MYNTTSVKLKGDRMKILKIFFIVAALMLLIVIKEPTTVLAVEAPVVNYAIDNNPNKGVELVDGYKIMKSIYIFLPEGTTATIKEEGELSFAIYNDATIIEEEGKYTLRVEETSTGEMTTINFEIDKSDPEFFVEIGDEKYTNFIPKGTYYEKVIFNLIEDGSYLKIKNLTSSESFYIKDGESDKLGVESKKYVLNEDGYYSLEVCEERQNGSVDAATFCTNPQLKYTFYVNLETNINARNNIAMIVSIVSGSLFVIGLVAVIVVYKSVNSNNNGNKINNKNRGRKK